MALDPAAMTPQEFPGPKFTIITKELQPMQAAPEGGDGRRRFRATASSTIEDMAGDEIELGALQKMAEKFRQGVTIFMDHKWKNVDAAFGLTDDAQIIQRGLDEKTGKPIYDLDIAGVVNTPNPRAVQLADSIDGGFVKLGTSVSALVRKHARKPNGAMLIKDLDVFEASIVGVPENQRSWAQKAAIAIKGFGHTIADQEDDIVGDNETEPVAATGAETPSETAEPVEGPSDDNEITDEAAPAVEPAAPAEPGSDESASTDGQESASAGETPETASEGAPAEEGADTPVTEKAYDPTDVEELVSHTVKLATEVGRLNEIVIQKDAEIETLRTKVAQYEGEAKIVSSELDEAAKVIEKALDMPLRPRAQAIVEEAATNSLFSGYPTIAEYLNKRRHLTNG